jgi:hypothetical protein
MMKRLLKSSGLTFALAAAALAGCSRKAPESAAVEREANPLVLEPKEPFVPENVPDKLKIQLISEKSSELSGGKFRYRLEIRNVGSAPVAFKDAAPSFIEDGSLCGKSGFRFLVTPPDGPEQALPCDPSAPAAKGDGLDVTLKPGEYLLTRPESPQNRFRALATSFRFDTLGKYRIRAAYSGQGVTAESNAVVFEALKVVKRGGAPDKLAPKSPDGAPSDGKKDAKNRGGEKK